MPTPHIGASSTQYEGRSTSGSHNITIAQAATEVDIASYTPTQYGEIEAHFDFTGVVWDAGDTGKIVTVRLYEKIDGTNQAKIDEDQYLVGTSTISGILRGYVNKGTSTCKITIQMSAAVAAQVAIDYDIIEGGV